MNIYCGNISFNTSDDDLKDLFSRYGEVVDGRVVTDRYSGRSRGFGFVEMSDDGEAKEAIDLLTMLQNKTRGNLSDKETQLFRSVISELQLQFTRAPTLKRQSDDDQAQSETIRETFANPREGPIEDISSNNEEE